MDCRRRTQAAMMPPRKRRRRVDDGAVTIEPIAVEQKSVLRQLMEFCSYDFSIYDQADVNEHGLFGYDRIDHYWTDPERYPFLIKVQGQYAGFVLVSRYQPGERPQPLWSICEFFVMRKYRRQGVGRFAARTIFDRYRGAWEVNQVYSNDISRVFWEAVIGDYAGGEFEAERRHADGCERQFLYFSNG
jgi:predicted acetyltransferase